MHRVLKSHGSYPPLGAGVLASLTGGEVHGLDWICVDFWVKQWISKACDKCGWLGLNWISMPCVHSGELT